MDLDQQLSGQWPATMQCRHRRLRRLVAAVAFAFVLAAAGGAAIEDAERAGAIPLAANEFAGICSYRHPTLATCGDLMVLSRSLSDKLSSPLSFGLTCIRSVGGGCERWRVSEERHSVTPASSLVGACVTKSSTIEVDPGLFFVTGTAYGTQMDFDCDGVADALVQRLQYGSWTIVRKPPEIANSAQAMMVNVAMVDAVAPGFVTAFRCSDSVPNVLTNAVGNHDQFVASSNLAVLSDETSSCLFNQKPLNLVVDLEGYFAPSRGRADAQLLEPLDGRRLLDTRLRSTRPAAGTIERVETGVQPGSSAVLVNLAMVDASAAGYVTADRCSRLSAGPQQHASANHLTGGANSNLVVVPVDPDGAFCIFHQQGVDLVVDLQGRFSPDGGYSFVPPWPVRRLLDTRDTAGSILPAGSITRVELGAASFGMAAALVNIAMTDGVAAGYTTAASCDTLAPGSQSHATGNHRATTATSNLALVPLDGTGGFCIFNQSAVNLVVDLQGTFSAGAGMQFFVVEPSRLLDTRIDASSSL